MRLGKFALLRTRPLVEIPTSTLGQGRLYNAQDLQKSKLALIDAEISLGRLVEPAKYPGNDSQIAEPFMDYLCYLNGTKRFRRLTWLDVGYRKREKALQSYAAALQGVDVANSTLPNNNEDNNTSPLTLPVIDYDLERLYRRRQLSQIPFNTNVIFDLTFDDHMSSLESKNLVEQLMRIVYFNKTGNNAFNDSPKARPFNLHFAGLSKSDKTKNFLEYYFNDKVQKFFPNVSMHEEDLTEMAFSKDKLVYLSPHSENTLEDFDPDCAYIIGGIVDRREIIELSPQKIKQLGIRSARLPTTEQHRKHIQSLPDVFKILYGLQSYSEVSAEIITELTNKYLPLK